MQLVLSERPDTDTPDRIAVHVVPVDMDIDQTFGLKPKPERIGVFFTGK